MFSVSRQIACPLGVLASLWDQSSVSPVPQAVDTCCLSLTISGLLRSWSEIGKISEIVRDSLFSSLSGFQVAPKDSHLAARVHVARNLPAWEPWSSRNSRPGVPQGVLGSK